MHHLPVTYTGRRPHHTNLTCTYRSLLQGLSFGTPCIWIPCHLFREKILKRPVLKYIRSLVPEAKRKSTDSVVAEDLAKLQAAEVQLIWNFVSEHAAGYLRALESTPNKQVC